MTGLVLLALMPLDSGHFDISWRLWVCGAGFGMFFSPNARSIIGSSPPARAAAAGSLVSTTRMLGQATGATLLAGLLAMGLGDSGGPLLVAAGLAGIALLISAANLPAALRQLRE